MIKLDFNKSSEGILPAIAQDFQTGEILMLAYINQEAFTKTIETKKAHYWSRSRNELWLKGKTSGHIQEIHDIMVDCDLDTVIYKVNQLGDAACHKGYKSCFYRMVQNGELHTIGDRVFDPADVYKK